MLQCPKSQSIEGHLSDSSTELSNGEHSRLFLSTLSVTSYLFRWGGGGETTMIINIPSRVIAEQKR